MHHRAGLLLIVLAVLTFTANGRAQVSSDDPPSDPKVGIASPEEATAAIERLSLHFQLTVAAQAHPSFRADYSGQNSLGHAAEGATAFVSTLYLAGRLWPGADLVINPEMSGGAGMSHTLGVAAFPSGLVYRVGDPAPAVYLARLELRQSFGLGGGKVQIAAGPNQLAGTRDRDSLTLYAGRLSVTDLFDGNAYAHDATTQFFNWALFASGAWDYPADTRGYTWGVLADLTVTWWSLRAGVALEPKYANLAAMEWRIDKARGLMAEYEARYTLRGHAGTARLLLFLNDARMGSYQQVVDDPERYNNDIAASREFGRTKYGFAISVDQRLNDTLGAFLRISANDGANESWAFTEIDRSLGLGLVQSGKPWCRDGDEVGLGVVVNGLSGPHRRYLAGGGYGFIIGDGALDYALEVVGDLYYRVQIMPFVAFSGIYQFIANPAYNAARGPVHVFSARLRIAF
jgi:high affinity Mn2+ porin